MIVGPARRESDPAIAHDSCGDAILRGGRDVLAPGHLTVIMGVNVDKARRPQLAARVDLFVAFAGDAANFDNAAVLDRDIRLEQLTAEPVRNLAGADDEIWTGG